MTQVDLIAGYWTLAGPVYPRSGNELSPIPLQTRVEAAGSAGFTGVGLICEDLMRGVAQFGYAGLRQLFDDNNIRHLELEFLLDWFASGRRRHLSDSIRRDLLRAADELGARDIKIAAEIDSNDYTIEAMIPAFRDLSREAAKSGTLVGLEMMPFSTVKTLGQALQVVEGADEPNGGVLLDIWHVYRGGIGYEEIAILPGGRIVAVEMNDGRRLPHGDLWNDTLHHRRLCGDGDFDCPAFIAALSRAGYRGPYSVEILAAELRRLPVDVVADQVFRTTMSQFATAQQATDG
jgi:sugar phosphate isomerase/epimerase